MTEAEAMERALQLAMRGWGQVAPNPMVGAVLLRDGVSVGEGFHARYGGPHAEVEALRACADPAGVTCVVNLEPCAHHGQTPPCTDALIDAAVARVVIAVRDPHRAAAGGVERLRKVGIEVEIGPSERAAAALNAPFLFSHQQSVRPFVAVKVATSLDGFVADTGGRSRWITGPEAREYAHRLRAGFDAIGVGGRTARTDDPRLTVRGPVTPRVPPRRVVFGRDTALPRDHHLAVSAPGTETVLFASPENRERVVEELRGTDVDVWVATGLEDALTQLRTGGVRSLLVEGGGQLVGALLAGGLVDRLYWFQAPLWLGEGTAAFGRRSGVALEAANPWEVTDRRAFGPDTLLVVDRELCLQGS